MFFSDMRYNYPKEIKLGVALILLFALLSNARLLKKEYRFDPKLIGHDWITQYEKRFENLRKILPPQGVVGYISDKEIKRIQDLDGNIEPATKYCLTRYTLAPIIVDISLEHDLVVGNFHQPVTNLKFPENREVTILKDFGNGVVLFKTKVK